MYKTKAMSLLVLASSIIPTHLIASNAQDPRITNAVLPDAVARGNFRVLCDFSHAAMDDPIVKWGQRGDAHQHFFFGNTLTDAFSTTESLLTKGGSTCQGQTLNRSAYWVPAIYSKQGQVRIPDSINIYYKHESDEPASSIAALPTGLRMIAGAAGGNTEETLNDVYWRCASWPYNDSFPNSQALPNCNTGDQLLMNISFPNCWDGDRLHSEDQSHMAYSRYIYDPATGSSNSLCPAAYPIHLPRISYVFFWSLDDESSDQWFIASDRHNGHSAQAGTTLHGDWWNGWDESIVDIWTEACLRQSRDCDTGNLGNGTALSREYMAGIGRIVKPQISGIGAHCNGQKATIVGTRNDDSLNGTAGRDVIVSFGGNDIINSYGGNDVICSGTGDDTIYAGDGNDEIRSGSGNDTIVAGSGRDRVLSGSGDDNIDAGPDADSVYGFSGNDIIYTGEGHDWAFGGSDDDELVGSYFNDKLFGQAGNDSLTGVGGENWLNGGSGIDNCDNSGAQTILIQKCP